MSYSGSVSVAGGDYIATSSTYNDGNSGTFSWGNLQGVTNHTWDGDLILNGPIGLAGGNYTIKGDLFRKAAHLAYIQLIIRLVMRVREL